ALFRRRGLSTLLIYEPLSPPLLCIALADSRLRRRATAAAGVPSHLRSERSGAAFHRPRLRHAVQAGRQGTPLRPQLASARSVLRQRRQGLAARPTTRP